MIENFGATYFPLAHYLHLFPPSASLPPYWGHLRAEA
jgi:hypothetical protein